MTMIDANILSGRKPEAWGGYIGSPQDHRMDAAFDRRQATYWASTTNVRRYDHPVVEAFARQRVRYIARLLRSLDLASALDVGCGDGFGMHYMQEIVATVNGCDRSAKMLAANPADRRTPLQEGCRLVRQVGV